MTGEVSKLLVEQVDDGNGSDVVIIGQTSKVVRAAVEGAERAASLPSGVSGEAQDPWVVYELMTRPISWW